MKITPEKMTSLDHIPTAEVEQDLANAERELHGYIVEKEAIESVGVNQTNKLRHFFLSAKVDKGREFIDELNQILQYRKNR